MCLLPVAVSHGIWQWVWCLCALWHHLGTHWCRLRHSELARNPPKPAPSDCCCQSSDWAAAGLRQRLDELPNLQEPNMIKISVYKLTHYPQGFVLLQLYTSFSINMISLWSKHCTMVPYICIKPEHHNVYKHFIELALYCMHCLKYLLFSLT